MAKTSIDWADSVFNPVWGCKFNCDYCYARRIAKRFGKTEAERNFELVERPQAWDMKFPAGSAVFVNSMSDVSFWNELWIAKMIGYSNGNNSYICLTKNFDYDINLYHKIDITNHYLGYTVTTNKDIDRLKSAMGTRTFNQKQFINIEPLLEPLTQESIKYLATAPTLIFGVETGSKQAEKNLKLHSAWIHTAVEEISSLVNTKIFIKQPALDVIIKEWNPYAAKEYRQLLWTTRKQLI